MCISPNTDFLHRERVSVELPIGALLDPAKLRRRFPGSTMGFGEISSFVKFRGLSCGAGKMSRVMRKPVLHICENKGAAE